MFVPKLEVDYTFKVYTGFRNDTVHILATSKYFEIV